jgi:predicted  nucleic acid-binding Zn-ribbon protein
VTKKLDPKLAEEVMLGAGFKPLEPYKNSKTKWKCECLSCNRIVFLYYANVKNGSQCIYCLKMKIDPKDAINRMNEVGLEPLEPFISSRQKWKSRCIRCGSIVSPALHDIRRGNGGCKKCGREKQVKATSYSEEEAKGIMLKANLEPIEPYRRSNLPYKSKCLVCLSIVHPHLSSILQGSGCIKCAANKLARQNKLDEEVAIQRMFKAGLKPLEPYLRADVGWKSECLKCGEIVYPHLTSIIKGGGCKYCAKSGFQMLKPSYIYLITNLEYNAHKIGVGNKRKARDRVKKFMNKGWAVHRIWEISTGASALKIETEIFKIIRHQLQIPVYLSRKQMPVTGGETETMDADLVSLVELEKIINKVIEGHGK